MRRKSLNYLCIIKSFKVMRKCQVFLHNFLNQWFNEDSKISGRNDLKTTNLSYFTQLGKYKFATKPSK